MPNIINITVIGAHTLRTSYKGDLAVGSNNFDQLVFSIEDTAVWSGYTLYGVIYQTKDRIAKIKLDSNNSCKIPLSVLEKSGRVFVGLRGEKSDDSIGTSNMLVFNAPNGAVDGSVALTPSEYDDIKRRLDKLESGSSAGGGDCPTKEDLLQKADAEEVSRLSKSVVEIQNGRISITWESGSVSKYGHHDNTNRVRSVEYIKVPDSKKVMVLHDSEHEIGVVAWDAINWQERVLEVFDPGWTDGYFVEIPEGYNFCKINIRLKTNANIYPDDITDNVARPMPYFWMANYNNAYRVIDSVEQTIVINDNNNIGGSAIQGMCFDGENIWYYLTGEWVLKRYNITSGTTTEYRGLGLNHGNDITYNPKTRKLYVALCEGTSPNVKTINIDTMSTETITLDEFDGNICSIAYSKELNKYVVVGGSSYLRAGNTDGWTRKLMVIYDENFDWQKKIRLVNDFSAFQGIDCDDKYIYFSKSFFNDSVCNGKVCVYDFNGNYINSFYAGEGELEGIAKINNKHFYIARIHGDYKGGYVYKATVEEESSKGIVDVVYGSFQPK